MVDKMKFNKFVVYVVIIMFELTVSGTLDYCEKVKNRFQIPEQRRQLLIMGPHNITVLWGRRAPSRGAAALLVMLIKYGLHYTDVHLRQGPDDLCGLASITRYDSAIWDDFIVDMSVAWPAQPTSCKALDDCKGVNCKFAGTRFDLIGPGVTPTSLRILAHLSPGTRLTECLLEDLWFLDASTAKHCNFLQAFELEDLGIESKLAKKCDNYKNCTVVLYPVEWSTTANELSHRLEYISLPYVLVPFEEDAKPRKKLLELLKKNISFLFFDHEIWNSHVGVYSVPSLPCVPNKKCPISIDDTSSIAIADSAVFQKFAPDVFLTLQDFTVDKADVMNILVKEFDLEDTLQAACYWVIKNEEKFKEKIKMSPIEPCNNTIFILYCSEENTEPYSNITNYLRLEDIHCLKEIFSNKKLHCNDENHLIELFEFFEKNPVAGVLAAGIGAAAISEKLSHLEIPIVLYDTLSPRVRLSPSVISASGSVSDLGIAMRYFLSTHNWNRIAVLSEDSWISEDFCKVMLTEDIVHFKLTTEYNSTKENLMAFAQKNAKIFVINTESNLAVKILCDALRLEMTSSKGYVWILREWPPKYMECDVGDKMKHYTITYGFRGGNLSLPSFKMQRFRSEIDNIYGNNWPPHTTSVVNAIQLLGYGFERLMKDYPQYRDNRQEKGLTRDLAKILRNISIDGVEGPLRINSNFRVDPYIYADEWRALNRTSLGIWSVRDGRVQVLKTYHETINSELQSDGTVYCYTTSSQDSFAPFCHDLTYLTAVVVVIILAPVFYKARNVRITRLRQIESKWVMLLLQERERLTTELLPHEVNINELEFQEEILGRGTEKLAILRQNEFPEQTVEVRVLEKETAQSSTDFLREASLLASLNNKNIVKFLGVCTNGSLMILTEYAYHGNLMRYLEKRSVLAELAHAGRVLKEAEHVSSLALTRMALDVASALSYLTTRRIVHRDVRANKCVVDIHRRVKLSNFMMARNLNTTEEYIDKGKGVYPLVFMPRESIVHGNFSTASDMWSFGVFLLELVKVGARPYGTLTQENIAKNVVEGKRPPIPYDASLYTRRLVAGCCQVDPSARMTAAQAVQFLTQHPLALQPTFLQEETMEVGWD